MPFKCVLFAAERYNATGDCDTETYLKRECAHLLFAGPVPFSKLQKRLNYELCAAKTTAEALVAAVAEFK